MMDRKNFTFRYPPPPPPNYVSNIIPPLPTDNPPVVQPPPPPPPVTVQNWTNWSVDFSRPPPPVLNGFMPGTSTNALELAYSLSRNTVVSPSVSPGSSKDNLTYYGSSSSDNCVYYGSDNSQYLRYNSEHYGSSQGGWSQNSSFKRPRFDGRVDHRREMFDNYYGKQNDSKYTRNTPNSDSRHSRDSSKSDSKKSKPEEGQRSRKRKKPLSQSVPAKRPWTDEEAQMAIDVEKEYNKIFKNHSLKIKFPDQELNREIVSKFHSSIETVYFQQPSNPRFCFVTLADGADPNVVIEQLNKVQFGLGFLSAEYKKEREEEQHVSPEDIDPLTLYVGNLAQEVTKEDILTFYPKNRRIDIGFAKKMRYTRYAFVSFKTVQDSIEAFKATHYADLHSKSMIVRFRRLHGTVGMPGEAKNFSSTKDNREERTKKDLPSEKVYLDGSENCLPRENDDEDIYSPTTSYDPRSSPPSCSPNHNNCDRRTTSESSDISNFDPSLVKSEPYDYIYDDYEDCHLEKTEEHFTPHQESSTEVPEKSTRSSAEIAETIVKKEPEFITPFLPEIPDSMFPIRPIPLKKEPNEDNKEINSLSPPQGNDKELGLPNGLKEPKVENEILEPVNPEDNEEEFNTTTDFGSVLENLKRRPFMP